MLCVGDDNCFVVSAAAVNVVGTTDAADVVVAADAAAGSDVDVEVSRLLFALAAEV